MILVFGWPAVALESVSQIPAVEKMISQIVMTSSDRLLNIVSLGKTFCHRHNSLYSQGVGSIQLRSLVTGTLVGSKLTENHIFIMSLLFCWQFNKVYMCEKYVKDCKSDERVTRLSIKAHKNHGRNIREKKWKILQNVNRGNKVYIGGPRPQVGLTRLRISRT